MNKDSRAFLEALMAAPSPSGFEQPVQRIVRKRMESFADEVSTDVHGNVIGALNRGAKLRVMLAGHADEIGLMVTHIDEQGYIYFSSVGGVDTNILSGQRALVHNARGGVPGVIGKKAIHLQEGDERKKAPEMKNLWLDIGAKDKKDALKAVEIGDPITLDAPFRELRNGIVVSRGFDDKVGAFIVTEALGAVKKSRLKVAVYAVSTVQEEIGLRGARTAAFGIDPHAGIAVDVGFASDCPDVDKKLTGEIKLGKGPILHRGANMNPALQELIEKTARAGKIPFQMQAEPRATGTDANAIQINRAGAAASLISIPNRYMHTPVEAVHLDDLDNAVRLIAAVLEAMTAKMSFIPE